MSILQGYGILATFVVSVLIIGFIKVNEKVKHNILMVMSFIYNIFIGFIDPMAFIFMWAFFSNHPKGMGYSVPAEEAAFNMMLGIVILILYLILFLPLNIFMKKKANVSIKTYTAINGIATLIGMVIFFSVFGFDLI